MESQAIQDAVALIKSLEGCRLKAYQDATGKWTIGFGATGMFITGQTVWSQDQADNDLRQRVDALYSAIRKHIMIALEPHQWAALISLGYNIGITNLFGSTLIKKLNERDIDGAILEFPKWDKMRVAGQLVESKGLLNRRLKEQAIFSGITASK